MVWPCLIALLVVAWGVLAWWEAPSAARGQVVGSWSSADVACLVLDADWRADVRDLPATVLGDEAAPARVSGSGTWSPRYVDRGVELEFGESSWSGVAYPSRRWRWRSLSFFIGDIDEGRTYDLTPSDCRA